MSAIKLKAEQFKNDIFDYTKSKDWNYKDKVPAIIDFYADWCGPCKMVAPILDELAEEYKGKLKIYKVDTEAQQELAAMFGIQSIPTLLYVPMEGKPQLAAGAPPKPQLVQTMKDILKI